MDEYLNLKHELYNLADELGVDMLILGSLSRAEHMYYLDNCRQIGLSDIDLQCFTKSHKVLSQRIFSLERKYRK